MVFKSEVLYPISNHERVKTFKLVVVFTITNLSVFIEAQTVFFFYRFQHGEDTYSL